MLESEKQFYKLLDAYQESIETQKNSKFVLNTGVFFKPKKVFFGPKELFIVEILHQIVNELHNRSDAI